MAKLYEIMREIEAFEFRIDEETGEILNCEELDKLEIERDVKIENICLWIKNLRADAKVYENEAASFRQKQKQAQNQADRLEEYIKSVLAGSKFKTNRVTVLYRKSNVVECSDIAAVDDDYLRYREPELNKKKIAEAIKQGIDVKGCVLVEKQNMQIK